MKSGALGVLAAAALIAGCAITQTVRPVTARGVTEICVKSNPKVMMAEFPAELRAQIEKKGIKTRMFDGDKPAACKHHLEYTANWRWDFAMYLVFAEINVYEDGLLVGQATYDAHSAGGRLDKFGATAEKLKGLLDQMFART